MPILTPCNFPSRYTPDATVYYGVLAAYLALQIPPDRSARFLIALVDVLLLTMIDISLLYLRVHSLSRIFGGVVEDIASRVLCPTCVYHLRLRDETQSLGAA